MPLQPESDNAAVWVTRVGLTRRRNIHAQSTGDFTGAENIAILRELLIEKRPISEVCDKHGLQPTLFYPWQKTLFEDGDAMSIRWRAIAQNRQTHGAGCARSPSDTATQRQRRKDLRLPATPRRWAKG